MTGAEGVVGVVGDDEPDAPDEPVTSSLSVWAPWGCSRGKSLLRPLVVCTQRCFLLENRRIRSSGDIV